MWPGSRWSSLWRDYVVLGPLVYLTAIIGAALVATLENPVTGALWATMYFLATDSHGINEHESIRRFGSYIYHLGLVLWPVVWSTYFGGTAAARSRTFGMRSGRAHDAETEDDTQAKARGHHQDVRKVALPLLGLAVLVHEVVFWLLFRVSFLFP